MSKDWEKNWTLEDEKAIINVFIGQAMKRTGNKANPVMVKKILEKMFNEPLNKKNK